jgi:hypothetical protein
MAITAGSVASRRGAARRSFADVARHTAAAWGRDVHRDQEQDLRVDEADIMA